MIGTVLRVGWLNLKRDRVEQALSFLLPIVFFSIFAGVFSGQHRATPSVRLAVVDEDGSDASRRLVAALQKEQALRVMATARPRGAPDGAAEVALDRAAAEAMVREGDLAVALVIPAGFGKAFGSFDAAAPKLRLLADRSDPIAPQIAQGLLQKAAVTGAPDLLMKGGMQQFERYGGALTPQQRTAVDAWLPQLDGSGSAGAGGEGLAAGFIGVEVVDVLAQRPGGGNMAAFYAAGTGVMFLLFMCAGAGGSLLEEMESGTLDRILGSRLGMGGLLAGKWLFLTLMGIAQITVMFLWGALVFKVPLFSHLPGFAAMTLVTASAAGGFGLVLASAARTRAQLSGISTIVILVMSAVGGSMFPRFLMSETMQKVGLFTFNGWALDGYVKVFWRGAAVRELWPQLTVLALLTLAFLALARLLARRWESV